MISVTVSLLSNSCSGPKPIISLTTSVINLSRSCLPMGIFSEESFSSMSCAICSPRAASLLPLRSAGLIF